MAKPHTPFDHQQQLDSESLRRLRVFNIGAGVSMGCTLAVPPGSIRTEPAEREQVR